MCPLFEVFLNFTLMFESHVECLPSLFLIHQMPVGPQLLGQSKNAPKVLEPPHLENH